MDLKRNQINETKIETTVQSTETYFVERCVGRRHSLPPLVLNVDKHLWEVRERERAESSDLSTVA